jgi:hypothetical protein
VRIDDICEAARQRGLASSRRQFSRDFLGRGANYLSDTKGGKCSAGALLHLYTRLGEVGAADLQAAAFARLLDAEGREGGARAVRA